MTIVGTQIDSDKRLLEFANHEEYLDSLVTPKDFLFLQSTKNARLLAVLGYRSNTETLDKDTFYRRLKAVKDVLFPVWKPYELVSENIIPRDAAMRELAFRERSNRLGYLSTIIFLRHITKHKFEISGYIDYSDRLKSENWLPYFEGKKILYPCCSDLVFYHWRTEKSCFNDTSNYQPMIEPKSGLVFKHTTDRKIVIADPHKPCSSNTIRTRINSDIYNYVVLIDHTVQNPV